MLTPRAVPCWTSHTASLLPSLPSASLGFSAWLLLPPPLFTLLSYHFHWLQPGHYLAPAGKSTQVCPELSLPIAGTSPTGAFVPFPLNTVAFIWVVLWTEWVVWAPVHFFFACFFACLCYRLALALFCFYSGPFFFVIYFILWSLSFWKAIGLTFVICHPLMLLQPLKRSVNFNTSWLQTSLQTQILDSFMYNNCTGKKQMWFQGPAEMHMKAVLITTVVKTLRNVEYWHLLTIGE